MMLVAKMKEILTSNIEAFFNRLLEESDRLIVSSTNLSFTPIAGCFPRSCQAPHFDHAFASSENIYALFFIRMNLEGKGGLTFLFSWLNSVVYGRIYT